MDNIEGEIEMEHIEVKVVGLSFWARSKSPVWALCHTAALATVVAAAVPAFASLGGNVNSVETDGTSMRATDNVTHAGSYDMHEIQSPGGIVVDEYVSSSGTVFAVTWRGQAPPQMQQVLGSYFAQYSAAVQAQPQHFGHRPLNIQEPGLVVQTGGHIGAYYGRAYVPGMLPSGVQADQIK